MEINRECAWWCGPSIYSQIQQLKNKQDGSILIFSITHKFAENL